MLFAIFKVSGHSMLPKLKPNNKVIISSIPYFFKKPRVGEMVVFCYNNKLMIKRITKVANDIFFVSGDNKKDSLKTESLRKEQILGKVIFVLAY